MYAQLDIHFYLKNLGLVGKQEDLIKERKTQGSNRGSAEVTGYIRGNKINTLSQTPPSNCINQIFLIIKTRYFQRICLKFVTFTLFLT